MVLSFLACVSTSTKPTPAAHSGAPTPGPTPALHSAAPGHTAECSAAGYFYEADGSVVTVSLPSYGDTSDFCLQDETLASVCDRVGWTEVFGACPTWDQFKDGVADGTITTIDGDYPLYPADQLTVDTCSTVDGDWHHVYLYPYQYYDVGGFAVLFDGRGLFAGFVRYTGYFQDYCCGGQVAVGLWTGALPPDDWVCDDGAPLVSP